MSEEKYETNEVGQDNQEQVFCYERDFYVFSNFSAFQLVWRDERFPTSEHAYQYESFVPIVKIENIDESTTDDKNTIVKSAVVGMSLQDVIDGSLVRTRIRKAPSAHIAFKIAQENKHLQDTQWPDVKFERMKTILKAKAEQHEYVMRKLEQSGDREIVEDSWRDSTWGWGENRQGDNLLGQAWMEVREELLGVPVPKPR